jgi:hypothetical protein
LFFIDASKLDGMQPHHRILVFALCLATFATHAVADEGEGAPAGARFKPWQRIWQCNDIRVTETVNQPGIVNYDLGGTIWGGSQFTLNLTQDTLYFNGRQCQPLR